MLMDSELGEIMKKRFTKKVPEDKLYQRIVDFLKEQTMCVLSTASPDGVPRSTPLEYYSHGMTLYILCDPGVKVENIKVNPRVSFGIYNDPHPVWTDPHNWARNKGAQITGTAKLLSDEQPEYQEGLNHYKWQIFWTALGRPLDQPPRGRNMIKIDIQKVEYTEYGLKRDGFASKQVWITPGYKG